MLNLLPKTPAAPLTWCPSLRSILRRNKFHTTPFGRRTVCTDLLCASPCRTRDCNFLKQERHLLISTMEDGRSHTVGVSDAVLDQDVNSTVDLVRNHATPAGETLLAPVAPIPDIPGISAIGVQAQEIIASILGDPAPGLAEVRHRLRKCLADHPGYPERALLAHLMQTSEQANSEAGEARPYA